MATKLLWIALLGTMFLAGQESTNVEYWAYQPFQYKEVGDKITIWPSQVIKAKLQMWKFWFAPHPALNRLEETFIKIQALETHLQEYIDDKKRTKRRVKIGAVLGTVGAVAVFFGGLKLGLALK